MRLPRSIETQPICSMGLIAVTLVLVAGCSAMGSRTNAGKQPAQEAGSTGENPAPRADPAGNGSGSVAGDANGSAGGAGSSGVAEGANAPARMNDATVSPQAAAEFERAVAAMRSGQTDVAERELTR